MDKEEDKRKRFQEFGVHYIGFPFGMAPKLLEFLRKECSIKEGEEFPLLMKLWELGFKVEPLEKEDEKIR